MFYINRLANILIGLAIILSVLTACASGVQDVQKTTLPSAGSSSNGSGYDDLVDALKAAGAAVEPGEEVEQPFFSVKAKSVKVNGADVQIFEYSDEAARKADSDLISPDGTSVGATMIDWVDQPNFWARGRLIVLYVGKDTATIDLLTGVLGSPITKPK